MKLIEKWTEISVHTRIPVKQVEQPPVYKTSLVDEGSVPNILVADANAEYAIYFGM
jgi:hypothetical protein